MEYAYLHTYDVEWSKINILVGHWLSHDNSRKRYINSGFPYPLLGLSRIAEKRVFQNSLTRRHMECTTILFYENVWNALYFDADIFNYSKKLLIAGNIGLFMAEISQFSYLANMVKSTHILQTLQLHSDTGMSSYLRQGIWSMPSDSWLEILNLSLVVAEISQHENLEISRNAKCKSCLNLTVRL